MLFREQVIQWFQKHPVHTIFASLPGAGEKLAPRLLTDGSRVSHGRASSILIGEHGRRHRRVLAAGTDQRLPSTMRKSNAPPSL